jgi:DNA (cytosine-5)-methyltransferase 1
MENIKILYVDLFCGAGGTSTGVEAARHGGDKCAKVVACVNHDANAIASHAANHPGALHFTEDIRTLALSPLVSHIEKMKALYPAAAVVLWSSLECTNFSKAKGGQPRNADSRTLAEHLFRYIEAISPDYIQIENVEEFMSWGDLDENGKPVSRDKGRKYMQWVKNVKDYGYGFQRMILNAADYGAYTSRKRFFGQFAKRGLPIAWPEPTYAKNPVQPASLFAPEKPLKRWNPVKEVLDFSDEGESIFTRSKPLSDKTLERILAGLVKFAAGGKDRWLIKYSSMSTTGKYVPPSVDEPCPVVSCQSGLGVTQCIFLSKQYSGHPESKNISVEHPAHTVTPIDHHALGSASFLSAYCGKKGSQQSNATSTDAACPTVTVFDRLSLVSPKFIVSEYSGGGQHSSVDDACPAVLTTPKQKMVSCHPWIMSTNFSNVGRDVESPAPTVTANRKHHYLMNPQFCSRGGSADAPCFTLIASMDKMPPYLVCAESGQMVIVVYGADTEPMRKIKAFMALYGIIDIKMRMLRIQELKRIMGFPKDYVLIGTQESQKKYIGNAVEVNMARALCEALVAKLYEAGIFKVAA